MSTCRAAKRSKANDVVESALFSVDILVSLAQYLEAWNLNKLSETCKHFGGANDQFGHSLIEEAARRVIDKEANDDEKQELELITEYNYVEKYDHLLDVLRLPLVWDQLIGKNIRRANGDRSTFQVDKYKNQTKVAISDFVMRSGRHFVELTSSRGACLGGIIRPVPGTDKKGLTSFNPSCGILKKTAFLQDSKNESWNERSSIACCGISTNNGCICSSSWEYGELSNRVFERWNDRAGETDYSWPLSFGGVTLGLLLDLDAGTLSAWMNGERMGVIKQGLGGEYCWFVECWSALDACSIKRGDIPVDAGLERVVPPPYQGPVVRPFSWD